jgi:hypothetical protein
VPDYVHGSELFKELIWPLKGDIIPVRDAMHFLEFAKDKPWVGDMMVDHTIQIAILISSSPFPAMKRCLPLKMCPITVRLILHILF